MEQIVPSNYTIGNVLSDGDSFFSSVGQCLEQLKGGKISVKMLRQECKKYALNCSALIDNIGGHDIHDYIAQIQYCENECQSPISGRLEVEGRIINKVFKVNIYVIEKQCSDNLPDLQRSNLFYKIIDESGYRPVEEIDFNDAETIYIIKEGNLNFKPILKINPEKNSDDDKVCKGKKNDDETLYEIREGTSGAGGHFYEIKLLMLLLQRLQMTDKFYLAKNMANVGAFDDVVFKYHIKGRDGVRKTKTIFLQAKHSDAPEAGSITLDSLLSPKGAFSLKKYFKSYREIERNFLTVKSPIFEGNFADCSFVIFTNYILEKPRTNNQMAERWHKRWIDKEADGFVITKGEHSKKLTIEKDINRDIIEKLSCSPLQKLAQEIYDYVFGKKKDTGMRIENEIFQEYQIPLANEVFVVNKNKPSDSKFSSTFLDGNRLWDELYQIAKTTQGISKDEFQIKLTAAKVNLFKTFGNIQLSLERKSFNNLATDLANIIGQSDSNLIKIDFPPNGIVQLANNIFVRDELQDIASEWVKFGRIENFTGQAKEFMATLKEKLAENYGRKDFGLAKLRFHIDGLPRFSLPGSDEDVTENEVKQFLSKLEFAIGQKNENDLDDIIKKELSESHQLVYEDVDVIYQSVKSQVETWWKTCNYFLTHGNKFVENSRVSIAHFKLSAFGNKRVEKNSVSFKETVVKTFKELIEQKQVVNIVADDGTTLLSSWKVCQTLDKTSGENSYIFVQMNHLLYIRDHVLQIFQTDDTRRFLVIENNSRYQKEIKWPEADFKELYDKLYKIIKKNNGKKIALVTENEDMLANYFTRNVENFRKERDNINLNHLTQPSQQKLMDSKVILNGKSVKMRDFVNVRNENANGTITSQTIVSLMKNDNLKISNAPQRLNDLDAAYTKLYEKMPMENLVRELYGSPEKNTIFVISGIQKPRSGTLHDELINYLRITDPGLERDIRQRICLYDERNDNKTIIMIASMKEVDPLKEFRQICSKKREYIIYWIEITGEHARLQQVYEPNFYIKRKFVYAGKIVLDMELILQNNPTAMYIFNAADGEKIEKLVKNLHVEYQRRFKQNCLNETIIFARSESEAEKLFEEFSGAETNTHVLKIHDNNTMQFIWHRSHGHAFDVKHNMVFESDLLIRTNNHHIFIFCNKMDKQKVMDMIEKSCETKQKQFAENCRNRNIIFSTAEAENEIRDKLSAHWLKMDGNDLVWEKSNGSLDHLRHFINEDRSEWSVHKEEQFRKEMRDTVIIADEPGMGKTTNLTSVSQQMLDDNWVIRINFLDCEDSIETLPHDKLTLEDVYNFISKVDSAGLRSESVKQLLIFKLDTKEHHCHPILIMFDGYDEISSKQQEIVITLLRFIKDHTSAKLWVTTRLHMMDVLENGLSTFATKFEPLVLEEQKEFLNRFWRVRLALLQKQENIEDKINLYSSKLLDEAADILGQTISGIMGVPLQLRLLAEGLMRDILNYLNGCDENPPSFDSLNVLRLYQKFFDEKYEIYIREKVRLVKCPPSIRKILTKGFDEQYKKSAMHLLFPDYDNLIYPTRISDDERDEPKTVGIIQSIGKTGKPYFVHRTFAEYFAAKLLTTYLEKKETNPKKYDWTTRFLITHIFEEKNIVIREFVDHTLSEGSPIHTATLANKIRDVIELTKDVTNPKCFDNLGRTALHLAARDGHLKTVKVLLDNGYDALSSDGLGKTPLHYATMSGHQDVVRHLLNFTADIDFSNTVFALPLHVENDIGNSLFRDEHSKSTNLLDINGRSAFSYATEINDWYIACMLILHGANISFGIEDHKKKFISYVTAKIRMTDYIHIVGLLLINYPLDVYFNNSTYNWDAILGIFISLGHTKVLHAIIQNMTSTDSLNFLESLTRNMKYKADISDPDNLKVAKFLIGKCSSDALLRKLGVCAARNGNVETLKFILEQEKECALHGYMLQAIKWGQQNIVMFIFENCSEYTINDKINTALYKAVEFKRLGIFKYLLDRGADINARNEEGKTLIQYAAEQNSLSVMPYLAKNCASNIISGRLGNTVENFLSFYKDESMQNEVMMNLSSIADVSPNTVGLIDYEQVADHLIFQVQNDINCSNERGTTLLHNAVSNQMKSFVKYLIKQGANINIKDKEGKTPLHMAVQTYCQGGNNTQTIIYLLQHGAMYNAKTENNITVFDYFSQSQTNSDVFKLLDLIDMIFHNFTEMFQLNHILERYDIIGAICGARNFSGNTVYHLAANSKTELLNKLLAQYPYSKFAQRNLQCSISNKEGNTPLHLAAANGNTEMVRMLIKYGCFFNSRNKENNTPKDLAQNNSHKNVVDFLQSIEKVFVGTKANEGFDNKRICKEFPNANDEDGKTMLHRSAENGDVDLAELLIKNVFINEKDNCGWTALHYSAKNDQLEIIKLLLNHGAIFNLNNRKGTSPLDVATGKSLKFLEQVNEMYDAVLFKSPEIAYDCLKSIEQDNYEAFVAAINSCDNFGNSLLLYATSANGFKLELLLLQNGASSYHEFPTPINYFHGKEIKHLLQFIGQLFKWSRRLMYSHKTIEECPDKLKLIQNCRDNQRNTIMHKAVDYPINYYRLEFLIKNGCDINAVNKNGYTVLDKAIENLNLDLVKWLLKNNAKVNNVATHHKLSLLQKAEEQDRLDIVDMFASLERT